MTLVGFSDTYTSSAGHVGGLIIKNSWSVIDNIDTLLYVYLFVYVSVVVYRHIGTYTSSMGHVGGLIIKNSWSVMDKK